MNFDDTPQEAEFRSTARKWIAGNAPKELEAELSTSSLGRIRLAKHDMVEVGKAWQKKKADGGWACPATSVSTRTCRSTRSRPRVGREKLRPHLERPHEARRLEGWATGYMVRGGASAPPHHED